MPFWRRKPRPPNGSEQEKTADEAPYSRDEMRRGREWSWSLLSDMHYFDPYDEGHRTLFDAICDALQEALLVEERSRVGESFHATATLIDSDFRGLITETTTHVTYKGETVIDHDDAAGRKDLRLGPWWPELRERQLANRRWLEESIREFSG